MFLTRRVIPGSVAKGVLDIDLDIGVHEKEVAGRDLARGCRHVERSPPQVIHNIDLAAELEQSRQRVCVALGGGAAHVPRYVKGAHVAAVLDQEISARVHRRAGPVGLLERRGTALVGGVRIRLVLQEQAQILNVATSGRAVHGGAAVSISRAEVTAVEAQGAKLGGRIRLLGRGAEVISEVSVAPPRPLLPEVVRDLVALLYERVAQGCAAVVVLRGQVGAARHEELHDG
mmetsp:Transcript_5358/g.15921  ORF Transcript_5358/g.15921 Transcript_5358/m.15921 type:complete len:231 (-) Transcript_5358:3105-3797(-)